MRRAALRGVAGSVATLVLLGPVAAEPASPPGMKLYVFSSGALTVPRNLLQKGAPPTPIQIPVGFFVVKHPKGNVLFDTGNNDKIITNPTYWGPFIAALNPVRTPDVAIDTQLAKIALKPEDIRYVVVSHLHLDHAGNLGKFPRATIVAQQDELRNAFWPEPGTAGHYIPGDVAVLRSAPGEILPNRLNVLPLQGDLDLFGDRSCVVKRWAGHTPGSQLMVVRLPKSGTIILTGDNVLLRDSVARDLLPDITLAYDPAGILGAYAFIRWMQAREGADFFPSHDPDAFATLKHGPDYYE